MLNDLKIGDILIYRWPHSIYKYQRKLEYVGKTASGGYSFRDLDCAGVYLSWPTLSAIPEDFVKLTELGKILYE